MEYENILLRADWNIKMRSVFCKETIIAGKTNSSSFMMCANLVEIYDYFIHPYFTFTFPPNNRSIASDGHSELATIHRHVEPKRIHENGKAEIKCDIFKLSIFNEIIWFHVSPTATKF